MRTLISALFLIAASTTANAETVRVAGVELTVKAPKGYCVVGNESPSERKLWDGLSKASGKVEIVHLVAACEELAAYNNGKAEYLNHVGYTAVTKTQGEVKTVPYSRSEFLGSIAKSKPHIKIDSDEVSRVLKKSLQDDSARATKVGTEILGIDNKAVYVVANGSYEGQDRKAWRTTNLGAITIAKSLPITVFVTAVEGKSHPIPQDSVLHDYLGTFLRNN